MLWCGGQGKLSGDLTEKWGILDINIGNIKTHFKKEVDESRVVLETRIQTEKGEKPISGEGLNYKQNKERDYHSLGKGGLPFRGLPNEHY